MTKQKIKTTYIMGVKMTQLKQCEIFGGVYKIINNINKKIYIGVTTQKSVNDRYHGSIKNTHNEHLRKSIEKYGIENFTVIENFDVAYSAEELNELESFYISYYDTMNPEKGYNKTSGGDAQFYFSEEVKQKLSDMRDKKEVYQFDKQGNVVKLYPSIQSVKRDGYSPTSVCACCNNRRKTYLGYVWSNTLLNKDEIIDMYKVSPQPTSKKTYQYTKQGDLVKVYSSSNETEKDGYLAKSIQKCCVGKVKSAHGFIWSYDLLTKDEVIQMVNNIKWSNDKVKVYQYDKLTGELIRVYDSVSETREYGFTVSNVRNCIKGKIKSVGGYIWSDKELGKEEVLNKVLSIKSDNTPRAVYQYTKDMKFVKKYDKQKDVANDGFSISGVCSCCKGNKKSSGGYIWKYEKIEE